MVKWEQKHHWEEELLVVVHNEWIQIEGLPLNMWNSVAYDMIGSHFGGLIKVSDSTLAKECLKAVVLHVRGHPSQFFLNTVMVPSWGGIVHLKIKTLNAVIMEGGVVHDLLQYMGGRIGDTDNRVTLRENNNHSTRKGIIILPVNAEGKWPRTDPVTSRDIVIQEPHGGSYPVNECGNTGQAVEQKQQARSTGQKAQVVEPNETSNTDADQMEPAEHDYEAGPSKPTHHISPSRRARHFILEPSDGEDDEVGEQSQSIDQRNNNVTDTLIQQEQGQPQGNACVKVKAGESQIVADSDDDLGSDMSALYLEERRQDELAESKAEEASEEGELEVVPSTSVSLSRFLIDENDLELIRQIFITPKTQPTLNRGITEQTDQDTLVGQHTGLGGV
ncbi:hypothetical protein Sjap_007735 [Stephania japonica]|uniref:DUF4283 domain-containing protein n=1 Tax=Stephania japonica TaxID=461633 RepID=A0AAP0PDT6_9MAGN